ncbi:MAG TPA: tyrosine-type recombinase/integrase [Ruminococcus sp.]
MYDFISTKFGELLKENGLKHIRYHNLRHSCASLLIANGVPMKSIQEWLGHANYRTTADVYSHFDFRSKEYSAEIISQVLAV